MKNARKCLHRGEVGQKSMSFDRVERFSADSIWGFLAVCKAEEEIVDGELVLAVDVRLRNRS